MKYEADDATADVVLDDSEELCRVPMVLSGKNVKMWRIVIFASKHLVMTVNRGLRGRESNGFTTVTAVLLMIASVCVIAKLPAIHT